MFFLDFAIKKTLISSDNIYKNLEEREAVKMRVDAYNAVSQIYQSNSMAVVKRAGNMSASSDKLEFSQTAKTYQTAKAAVAGAADVRMDKIAEIKARMAKGTYKVSSQDIAEKIISGMDTIAF